MLLLDGEPIELAQLWRVAHRQEPVGLAPTAAQRMSQSRRVVESILSEGSPVYGVNTGFGKLSDFHVPLEELENLQLNLVRSHACGLGDPLSAPEVRAMMVLRANVLAKGLSGARPQVAEQIIHLLEMDVVPLIPEKGSVGASGDLAPLAHLALTMIGEGEVLELGGVAASAPALERTSISPLILGAKEGLALLNGTQAMGAVGGLAVFQAQRLIQAATAAGAMTLEALLGTPDAFDRRIQAGRAHPGQEAVAAQLRDLLHSSEIRESHRDGDPRVQDAYSLRCMPQVHGAARDVLDHVSSVLQIESGSATDNPLVFAESGDVVSGGNFHGAPLAYAFDYAAISLCDLAAIIERRIDRLVNPDLNEGLPAFLAPHPGSSSGMMIVHVAAASVLAECRVLAHPSSVDSVPTSGGKEDHVSMGMTSALKLRAIVRNLETMIAIELIAGAQGIDYRRPLRAGTGVERVHRAVRETVAHLDADRPLGGDIQALSAALRDRPTDFA